MTTGSEGIPRDVRQSLPRPDWLPERVWPFDTFGVKVEGTVIAVTDVGHGPALLFVHTGFWSFVWRDVIRRLAPDFRCICFDAPGTGRSECPPASAITLEAASQVVDAVIQGLTVEEFTLVVHDLGGPTGIAAAARMPEKVRGIVAVNTFGWRPSGALFRGMLSVMGSSWFRGFDVLTGLLPKISATSFGVGKHMDDSSRQAFLGGIGDQGITSFHCYMRDARFCDALYEEVERALTGRLHRLPVVTIFGERNDPLGFQPRWRSLFPSAPQVVIAKGNHFPMCDDPELVAETIRGWHRRRVARPAGG